MGFQFILESTLGPTPSGAAVRFRPFGARGGLAAGGRHPLVLCFCSLWAEVPTEQLFRDVCVTDSPGRQSVPPAARGGLVCCHPVGRMSGRFTRSPLERAVPPKLRAPQLGRKPGALLGSFALSPRDPGVTGLTRTRSSRSLTSRE